MTAAPSPASILEPDAGASPAGGPTLSALRPGPTAEDEAYDIRIARDGTWYYMGSPIGRMALVKLFATVLRRDEAGDYWLITPAERGRIIVDDTPFVAVELTVEGTGEAQTLQFRSNLDHVVTAGPEHPILVEVDPASGQPHPTILIRQGLPARIGRAVFYQLVDLAEEQPDGQLMVRSQGVCFSLGSGAG